MQSRKEQSVQTSYTMHLIGAALMAEVDVKKSLIRAVYFCPLWNYGTNAQRTARDTGGRKPL